MKHISLAAESDQSVDFKAFLSSCCLDGKKRNACLSYTTDLYVLASNCFLCKTKIDSLDNLR